MKSKNKSARLLTMLLAVVMVMTSLPIAAFAAPASDIPEIMFVNAILTALEYTAFDGQQQ